MSLLTDIRGESNIVITLKDKDTGVEVFSSLTIMTANQAVARKELARCFKETLDRLWPMELENERQETRP